MVQLDNLYRREVHILEVKSEFNGQFGENSVLKERGDWTVPLHFVKQMSSDLNI